MILHTTFCKFSNQKICWRQTDVLSRRFCHTRIKLTVWMFRNYPSENLKRKKVSFIKQQLNDSINKVIQSKSVPSGTNHHRSPKVDLPSNPPINRWREPIDVIEWYARAAGGSLPVGKHFHCADTNCKKETQFFQ